MKSKQRQNTNKALSSILGRNLEEMPSGNNQQLQKQIESYKKDEVLIIDYNQSREKKGLSCIQLSNDIKKLDQKNIQNLIIKCQRLFLIDHHKLYLDMINPNTGKPYQSKVEFAEMEHRISRQQLTKYIRIYEKLENKLITFYKSQKRKSTCAFEISLEKFYLLSQIEESEKIDSWFDIVITENPPVKELKKKLSDEKNQSKNMKVDEKKHSKSLQLSSLKSKLVEKEEFTNDELRDLKSLRDLINNILKGKLESNA